MFKKSSSLAVIVCFFLTTLGPLPKAHADSILDLPTPGTMINLSPAYQPVIIKGLTVHKDNPFLFDFIVDVGQDKMSGEPLKKEGEKLIKYFLASLAIPDKDVWVNLSPYEKNKMIPEALGQTDMGRDLLEQDYILKQITASLIYPEKTLGKTFWDRVYAKSQEMYGTTQIPVNTFNKVWIMADRAEVFEHNQTAFVVDSHLKVMLEEDYLALTKHQGNNPTHSVTSQIIRQIILPELEKEVNTGKNFANLRQIFNSIILSSWYKRNLKEALLNQVYANKSNVNGVIASGAKQSQQQIYEQYLKAYKKGVFNYIKEDVNKANEETVPRKYFSGGMEIAPRNVDVITDFAMGVKEMRKQVFNREVDFATLASPQDGKLDRRSFFTSALAGVAVGVLAASSKIKAAGISHDKVSKQQFLKNAVNNQMTHWPNNEDLGGETRIISAIALGNKNFLIDAANNGMVGRYNVRAKDRVTAAIALRKYGFGATNLLTAIKNNSDAEAGVMAAIALGDKNHLSAVRQNKDLRGTVAQVLAAIFLEDEKYLEEVISTQQYYVDPEAMVMAATKLDNKTFLKNALDNIKFNSRARVGAAIALGNNNEFLEDAMNNRMTGQQYVDPQARVMAASGITELKILGLDAAMNSEGQRQSNINATRVTDNLILAYNLKNDKSFNMREDLIKILLGEEPSIRILDSFKGLTIKDLRIVLAAARVAVKHDFYELAQGGLEYYLGRKDNKMANKHIESGLFRNDVKDYKGKNETERETTAVKIIATGTSSSEFSIKRIKEILVEVQDAYDGMKFDNAMRASDVRENIAAIHLNPVTFGFLKNDHERILALLDYVVFNQDAKTGKIDVVKILKPEYTKTLINLLKTAKEKKGSELYDVFYDFLHSNPKSFIEQNGYLKLLQDELQNFKITAPDGSRNRFVLPKRDSMSHGDYIRYLKEHHELGFTLESDHESITFKNQNEFIDFKRIVDQELLNHLHLVFHLKDAAMASIIYLEGYNARKHATLNTNLTTRREFLSFLAKTTAAATLASGGAYIGSLSNQPVSSTAQDIIDEPELNGETEVILYIAKGPQGNLGMYQEHLEGVMNNQIPGRKIYDDITRVRAAIALGVNRNDVKRFLENALNNRMVNSSSNYVRIVPRVMAAIALGIKRDDVKEFLRKVADIQMTIVANDTDWDARVMAAIALGIDATVRVFLEKAMNNAFSPRVFVSDTARVRAAIALNNKEFLDKAVKNEMDMPQWYKDRKKQDQIESEDFVSPPARIRAAIHSGNKGFLEDLINDRISDLNYSASKEDKVSAAIGIMIIDKKIANKPGLDLAMTGIPIDNSMLTSIIHNPSKGGIDLNTSSGMQWKVSKDGRGVEMNIDPVMIERIKREGIESLSPVIFDITPVNNIWSLVGLQAPVSV